MVRGQRTTKTTGVSCGAGKITTTKKKRKSTAKSWTEEELATLKQYHEQYKGLEAEFDLVSAMLTDRTPTAVARKLFELHLVTEAQLRQFVEERQTAVDVSLDVSKVVKEETAKEHREDLASIRPIITRLLDTRTPKLDGRRALRWVQSKISEAASLRQLLTVSEEDIGGITFDDFALVSVEDHEIAILEHPTVQALLKALGFEQKQRNAVGLQYKPTKSQMPAIRYFSIPGTLSATQLDRLSKAIDAATDTEIVRLANAQPRTTAPAKTKRSTSPSLIAARDSRKRKSPDIPQAVVPTNKENRSNSESEPAMNPPETKKCKVEKEQVPADRPTAAPPQRPPTAPAKLSAKEEFHRLAARERAWDEFELEVCSDTTVLSGRKQGPSIVVTPVARPIPIHNRPGASIALRSPFTAMIDSVVPSPITPPQGVSLLPTYLPVPSRSSGTLFSKRQVDLDAIFD